MKKTLYELALDYEESVRLTQQQIENVRAKMLIAKKERNFDELYSLKRKQTVLYEELVDLKITANKLKNYYVNENGRIAI